MTLLATPASPQGDQAASPADSSPSPISKWRTPRAAAITGIALLVGFGAWFAISSGSDTSTKSGAAAAAAASTQKLAGTFTIYGGGTAADACAGPGATGEVLKVTNPAGAVLSQGALGSGTAVPIGHGCAYSFSVPRPSDGVSYLVEVGDRGSLSFTRAQMAAAHWKLAINIGSQQPTG